MYAYIDTPISNPYCSYHMCCFRIWNQFGINYLFGEGFTFQMCFLLVGAVVAIPTSTMTFVGVIRHVLSGIHCTSYVLVWITNIYDLSQCAACMCVQRNADRHAHAANGFLSTLRSPVGWTLIRATSSKTHTFRN